MSKKRPRNGYNEEKKSDYRVVKSKLKSRTYGPIKLLRSVYTEAKYFDVATLSSAPIVAATDDTTCACVALSDVLIGDDRVNRTGRKIMMEQLHLRFLVKFSSPSVGVGNMFRVVVFQDSSETEALAAIPTPDNVYVQDTTLGSPNIIFWGHRNLLQPERFKVLMDWYTPACTTGNNDNVHDRYYEECFRSFDKGWQIGSFDASSTAMNRNRIYIFFCCTLADNGTTIEPQLFIHSRLKFHDV